MTEIPNYRFARREDLSNNPEFLPTRAEGAATGWDVRAALVGEAKIQIKPFEYFKIPLGIRAFCPPGWWFDLKPRSSTFAKKHIHALYGVIDETYDRELVFAGQYIPDVMPAFYSIEIKFGEAIGQIIPVFRQEMTVEDISNEEYLKLCNARGTTRGGFGSTDKK